MVYIRLKKKQSSSVKEDHLTYAYLVKTRRMYRNKKVIQKNIRYLGRTYKLNSLSLELSTFLGLDASLFIESNQRKDVILKLIEFELINHGFKKINNKLYLFGNEIKVDLEKIKIKNAKNKDVVLEINEGFLCGYTINSILNFKFPNLNEKECGKYLASILLSAGIKLDEQLFLNLFDKFFKDILPSTN